MRAEGTFAGFIRDRDGKDTLALRVCENDHLMSLFDPRVISVGDDNITFAGFECVGGVWVKQ